MVAESAATDELTAPIVQPGLSTFDECQAILSEVQTGSATIYHTGLGLLSFDQVDSHIEIYHLCVTNDNPFKVPVIALVEAVELELPRALNQEILIEETDFGLGSNSATHVPVYSTFTDIEATIVAAGKIRFSGFTEDLNDGDVTALKQIWVPNTGKITAALK